MRCRRCANRNLVAIRLTIATNEVSFHRCPRCEAKAWTGPTGPLTRERVLELVRAAR